MEIMAMVRVMLISREVWISNHCSKIQMERQL
jgi:hypothetical protein